MYNFTNSLWAIMPMKFVSYMPVTWRHLVPLTFVISLVSLGLLSSITPLFFLFFIAILVFYFSNKMALDKREWRYMFVMPFIFTLLHIVYGLGSLLGLLRVVASKQFWENRIKALLAV